MNQFKDFQENMRKARKGINEAKSGVLLLARDLCENKLRFGYDIDQQKAKDIVEMMTQLLQKENSFQIKEQVFHQAITQYGQLRDLEIDNEQKLDDIEGYVANLKIRDYIEASLQAKTDSDQFDPKDDVYYKQMMDLLYDQNPDDEENDGDCDMQVSQVFTIPIDPISKIQIEEPIRSIRCKHVYDRNAFEAFIRNKTQIQCPVAGCSNKNMTKNDVYSDEKLRLQIELEKEKVPA